MGPQHALPLSLLLAASPAFAWSPPHDLLGPATVRNAKVKLKCRAVNDYRVACEVTSTFTVISAGGAELKPRNNRFLHDGRPFSEPRRLETGEQVRVRQVRELWLVRDQLQPGGFFGEPLEFSALRTRHPFIGHRRPEESWDDQRRAMIVLAHGPEVTLDGRLAIEDSSEVHVNPVEDKPGLVAVKVLVRSYHDLDVIHGGPVLGLGWVPGTTRDTRLFLRAGYEFGIFEHLIASALFDTDFEYIAESLVLEVATPSMWLYIPSVGAGAGIVARQLDEPGVALRLRATLTYPVLGLSTDVDYSPATGKWIGRMFVRVGI